MSTIPNSLPENKILNNKKIKNINKINEELEKKINPKNLLIII